MNANTKTADKTLEIPTDVAPGRKNPCGCRFCGAPLTHTFVDLGMSPLCESYVASDELDEMEAFYPLHAFVCEECFLVQLREYVRPEDIFCDYAYFSSYSESWLGHARQYVDAMIKRFNLGSHSQVVEVASNDGYLLQYFVQREIPALGIEPAANVARVARQKGVETRVKFFGRETARELCHEGIGADLLLGNNVLAHVPDLNDFVAGLKIALAPRGVLTMEFPHLLRLLEENQFDTIYHEHFCYFSLLSAREVFAAHGLRVFDVEELSTHGGSLRVFVCHDGCDQHPTSDSVELLVARERLAGLDHVDTYQKFTRSVHETKWRLLEFLIEAQRDGKHTVGYGAPGKGNTLLNFCGIRTDLLDYTVDRNPFKHGKYLPGTHIPIFAPDKIKETKPDYVILLPWNLREELIEQLSFVANWGGKLVVPIPQLEVVG